MGIVVRRKTKFKKIKFSQKLLDVKEYTRVEGPTNGKAAMSTTRKCNNNDNNIKERLVWSGYKRNGEVMISN